MCARPHSKKNWFLHGTGLKIRVPMFYFDSNTIVPLKCPELAFWKANVDRMTFGRLFLLFPPSIKNTHLVFLMYHIYERGHQNMSQWPSNRHLNHKCYRSSHFSWWPCWSYVFMYFADDQIKSRSVLILCLHHVTSHSIVVTW